jgi:putative NADH-flavin reductase
VKLLILGATGGIGRECVAQALQRNDSVTALVRSSEKLTAVRERIRIIAGNPLDRATLDRALPGHDAVLSILGHPDLKPSMLVTDAARALTAAMLASDVKRLVIVSTTLLSPGGGLLTKIPLYLTRHAITDSAAMEEVVRSTPLSWTILRLVRLTNGKAAPYRIFDERPPNVFESLSRKSAATCMLDLARDSAQSQRIVAAHDD